MPPIPARIRNVVQGVLDATEPPRGGHPHFETWGHKAVWGYLLDSRRMLKALLILGANDLDDVGDGLARATYEQAATAGWLTEDMSRFETIMAAYDSDWADVRRTWERDHPDEEFPHASDPPLVSRKSSSSVRLPSVRERAKAAGLGLGFAGSYKLLSMSLHPTLLATSAGLDPCTRTSRL